MSIVERMARAIFEHWQFQGRMAGTMAGANPVKWIEGGNSFKQEETRDYARAALTAAGLTEAQLEGLANGTHYIIERPRFDEGPRHASDDFRFGEPSNDEVRRAMLAAKEG